MENNTMTGKKVLVVEDEEDVSIYLSRIFEEGGFHATRAANGRVPGAPGSRPFFGR